MCCGGDGIDDMLRRVLLLTGCGVGCWAWSRAVHSEGELDGDLGVRLGRACQAKVRVMVAWTLE